jgi:5'-methylthioadenosine phosphorylase
VTDGAEIGVIGGSGLYALLDDPQSVAVETPYGPPSAPIVLGELDGRRLAFLPRHGADHRFPPHRIPYRANVWALASLGVRQVLAPCAVGSLSPAVGPGTLVVCDQLVDRTSGRSQTFHDTGAVHVPFADPYCPIGRRAVLDAAQDAEWPVVAGGTMVVVEGPRFSTRAESQWFAAQGWSVVNMTGHPEAVLCRELSLCYTAIALVTDLDAGLEGGSPVTQQEVFRVFAESTARLRSLLLHVAGTLPLERDCACSHALDGIDHDLLLP